MTPSRATTRTAFASAIETALAGDVQTVYSHLPADFGGASPVLAVGARGSRRTRVSRDVSEVTFRFDVFVFVVAADAAAGWDEADAEDAIDAIECGLADLLASQPTNAAWIAAAYDGDTACDYLTIGGVEYRRERIPVALTVA